MLLEQVRSFQILLVMENLKLHVVKFSTQNPITLIKMCSNMGMRITSGVTQFTANYDTLIAKHLIALMAKYDTQVHTYLLNFQSTLDNNTSKAIYRYNKEGWEGNYIGKLDISI